MHASTRNPQSGRISGARRDQNRLHFIGSGLNLSRQFRQLAYCMVALAISATANFVGAQDQNLLKEVEQNVQRLINGHLDAADRARKEANPLTRKEPDPAKLAQDIHREMERLIGQEVVLDATVAGFHQTGDRVLVAFLDKRWLDDPGQTARAFRFKFHAEAAIEIVNGAASFPKDASQMSAEDIENMFLNMGQMWLIAGVQPHLVRSSPLSFIGEVGVNVEKHIAEGFDLGDKYACKMRITGYSRSWEQTADREQQAALMFPNMMARALAEENPELGKIIDVANQLHLSIQCEWARSASEVRLADLDVAIKGNRQIASNYAQRGAIRLSERQFEKAIEDLDQAIALDPKQPVVWHNRGICKLELYDYLAAADDFAQAVELDPKADLAFYHRGLALMRVGQYPQAIASLDRAVELKPKEHLAFRGRVLLLNRQYKEAIQDFDRLLQLDPNKLEVMAERGWASMGLAEYEQARKDFEKHPKDAVNQNMADFGSAYLKSSSPHSADRDGKAAISRMQAYLATPETLMAFQLDVVAAAHAEAGQFDKAVEFITLAIEKVEHDPIYRDHPSELRDRLALYQSRQPFRLPISSTVSTIEMTAKVKSDQSAGKSETTARKDQRDTDGKPFFIGKWKPNMPAMEKQLEQFFHDSDLPPDARSFAMQFFGGMEFIFDEDGTTRMNVQAMGHHQESEGEWEIIERIDANTLLIKIQTEDVAFNNEPGKIKRLPNGNLELESDNGPTFILQQLK